MRTYILPLVALLAFISLSIHAVEGTSGAGTGSGSADSSNSGPGAADKGAPSGGLNGHSGAVGSSGSTGLAENPSNAAGSYNATPSNQTTGQKAATSMFNGAVTNKTSTMTTPPTQAQIMAHQQAVTDAINAAANVTSYQKTIDDVQAAIATAAAQGKTKDKTATTTTSTKTTDKTPASPTSQTPAGSKNTTKSNTTKSNTSNFGGLSHSEGDGQGRCEGSFHTRKGEDQCEKNKAGEWVPKTNSLGE